MAENDVVYSYTADTSGLMDDIDTLMEGIQGLIGSIEELVEASSGLGEFEGIFEEIASIFSEVNEAAGEASAGISAMAEEAGSAAESLSALGADGEALTEIGTSAEDASAQIEGLQSVVSALSDTIAEDTSTIDGLNDTITNLQGQLDALATSEETASSGASGFGSVFNSIQDGFSSFTDGLGGIGEGISGVMGGIGDFIGGIGDVADSVFMGAMKLQIFAQMAQQLGQTLLGPAATAQQTQVAFDTLMHSTSAAAQEMQQLNTFASQTPFQTQDIDDAAEKMLAFGFNAKDVIPDIKAIGDSLSSLGEATGPQLEGVVQIFGKIQATGKLTTGDINQLASRGIPAWNMLSQVMGKPVSALQTMVSQGAIPAQQAIDALTKGMEKTFGGGMATQAQTFNGIMSTLQSNATQAMAALGGPLLQAASGGLSNLANTLASPGFQSFASGVGKQIADAFANIGKLVQDNVSPAVNEIVKGLESPGFKQFAAGVGKDIFVVFQNIGGFIKNDVTPAIGGFIKFLESPSFASFSNSIKGIAGDVGQVLGPALAIGKQVFEGIGTVIAKVWPPIANQLMPAIKNLASALAPLVAGIITWIEKSGIIPGIFNVIGNILGFVVTVISGIVNAVAAVIGVFTHWGDTTKSIGGFFSGLWKDIQNIFGGIGKWFTDRFNEAKSGLKTALDAIVNVVKTGANFLLNAFMAPIRAIAGAFVWLYNHNYYFKALVDTITNVVKAGLAWLEGAWNNTVNWLVGAWNNIVKFATDLWGKISGAIQTGFSAAIGFVEGIWNDISTTFSNAWSTYVSRPLTTLWTNVSTFFSGVWNTYISKPISDLWTSISTTVGGWAGKAVDWGKNLIQGFINGITGMLSSVGDAASKIAGKVAQFLGFHSPTELGPGADADKWAPALMNMFIDGIAERQARLKQVVDGTAKILSDSLNTQLHSTVSAVASISTGGTLGPNAASLPQGPNPAASGGLGGAQSLQYLQQIAQGVQRQQIPQPTSNTSNGVTQQYNTLNIGHMSGQELLDLINYLQGQQFMQGQRGASFNTFG